MTELKSSSRFNLNEDLKNSYEETTIIQASPPKNYDINKLIKQYE